MSLCVDVPAFCHSAAGKTVLFCVLGMWALIATSSGVQEMPVLFEQSVYFCLACRDNPAAITFQKILGVHGTAKG
jgi:hypothetical protein